MNIDFHIHGKIEETRPFSEENFFLSLEEAKDAGLNAIAITDHAHAKNFYEGHEFLNQNYKLIGDYYDVSSFKVFYGVEVTTKEMLDILFIGSPKEVIKLRNKIYENLTDEIYLDINSLFKLYDSNNLLVVLAHPYRKHNFFPKLDKEITEKIDAAEFNAEDLLKRGITESKDEIIALAKSLNLNIISGSDSHHFIQVGSIKNKFSKDCKTVKEIKEEIKKHNYTVSISNTLKIRVKSARKIKELICKN